MRLTSVLYRLKRLDGRICELIKDLYNLDDAVVDLYDKLNEGGVEDGN